MNIISHTSNLPLMKLILLKIYQRTTINDLKFPFLGFVALRVSVLKHLDYWIVLK